MTDAMLTDEKEFEVLDLSGRVVKYGDYVTYGSYRGHVDMKYGLVTRVATAKGWNDEILGTVRIMSVGPQGWGCNEEDDHEGKWKESYGGKEVSVSALNVVVIPQSSVHYDAVLLLERMLGRWKARQKKS